MFKPQSKTVIEAVSENSGARLHGEQLALVSAQEQGKWPLGRRVLVIVVLAWLAVLYLPGLMTDLAGLLLGLLFQAIG